MKNGLKLLAPIYSAHRMVEDYVQQAYLPAYKNYLALSRDNFTSAKELAAWRMDLMTKWSDVKIRNVRYQPFDEIFAGDKVQVQAELFVNGLSPEDISVEIYAGAVDVQGNFTNRRTETMQPKAQTSDGWIVYEGHITPDITGRFGFTVRVLPDHPLLLDPHCLGLIHWAQ
jgi:starch phosphorylase